MPGDSNHDGQFNAADLTAALQAGEYEDGVAKNSTFEEGDWDGDGDFTTLDIIYVFQSGFYQEAEAAMLSASLIFETLDSDHGSRANGNPMTMLHLARSNRLQLPLPQDCATKCLRSSSTAFRPSTCRVTRDAGRGITGSASAKCVGQLDANFA